MAIAALNSTTLSAALDAKVTYFQVASSTNISAGNILIVNGEAMRVDTIPSSGWLNVLRGWDGTRARKHASGSVVYIGAPDKFQSYRDYSIGVFGDEGNFPRYPLPGARGRDGYGNEYVLCDFTSGTFTGCAVVISVDGLFNAAPFTQGTHGPVGLAVEKVSTSDLYSWVQIYGYHAAAQDAGGADSSAATSSWVLCAASSASTPATGFVAIDPSASNTGQRIYGALIVGAATSATTATTGDSELTGVTYPVFLNYPWTDSFVSALASSASLVS